jgi:hypothetical protein
LGGRCESKKRFSFAKRRGAACGDQRSITREQKKIMLGPIIIFALAVAIVATYIFIVNRFLRSDEHWNENSRPLAPVSRQRPVTLTVVAQTRSSTLTPNRA